MTLHATPGRVVARSGVITMVLKSIWSSSRLVAQVDSPYVITSVAPCVFSLIRRHWCRLPCLSRFAWRTMFGHIWHWTCVEFEAAECVRPRLLSQMPPDVSTCGTMWDWDARPQCEARLSIVDVGWAAAAFCTVSISAAINLRKFTIRIALYVRHIGCCLG